MVLGFDKKILQMAFQVPEELIEEILSAEKPPSIVHLEPKNETNVFDWREGIIEAVLRGGSSSGFNKSKKKKTKSFNIFKRKPDFENCNGWSLAVDSKTFRPLRDSNIGVFLVNLTKGSMMGPHWNPRATEISIVIHGQGIVTVVCSGAAASDCKNSSIMVKEGDVFVVPRFHPMAQISFNNDSLVFMGFSTMAKNNYPQYLAGKSSVLQTINREILATSFNVSNTTIDKLLAAQADFIILDCTSCAEEEERRIEEEIEKQKQEEEEREREAAAKKREEEEAKRREEEDKRREEEEAKRREEEEEAKQREEEEEAKRREEEEEEAKRREEEEAKKREEEEEAKKREEEEEAKRREEEAKRREEEEAAKKREEEKEEEEEAQRQKEEEEAKRREEEEAQRQKEEEEEARRQQEEEEEAKKREEEEARRREEEEAQRQKEEEEAARRREEEEAQRQREEEAQRKEEEEAEAQRKREEEKRKEEGEGQRHGGGGEEEGEGRRVLRKMWKI